MPAPLVAVPGLNPDYSVLSMQIKLMSMLGAAGDGPSIWVSAIYKGNSARLPCSWPRSCLIPVVMAICGE